VKRETVVTFNSNFIFSYIQNIRHGLYSRHACSAVLLLDLSCYDAGSEPSAQRQVELKRLLIT